jgi:hypothetical protein
VEIELTPEPDTDVAEAVAEAVARALAGDSAAGFDGGFDPGPWWRAGIRENVEPDAV